MNNEVIVGSGYDKENKGRNKENSIRFCKRGKLVKINTKRRKKKTI